MHSSQQADDSVCKNSKTPKLSYQLYGLWCSDKVGTRLMNNRKNHSTDWAISTCTQYIYACDYI